MSKDTVAFGTCGDCGKAGQLFAEGCEYCKPVETTKYELSKDQAGLLRNFVGNDGKQQFYHVHSGEMTTLENWIHTVLLEQAGARQTLVELRAKEDK